MDFRGNIDILKADSRGQFIRGWAYVVADEGGQVVDYSGDVMGGLTIDEGMQEIRKSAHDFISDFRTARVHHGGKAVGEIVESVIIDDAFADAVGAVTKRRGWWIGMRVDDEAIQKRIRSGDLKQFSIGGRGKRLKVEGAAA